MITTRNRTETGGMESQIIYVMVVLMACFAGSVYAFSVFSDARLEGTTYWAQTSDVAGALALVGVAGAVIATIGLICGLTAMIWFEITDRRRSAVTPDQ